MTGTERGGTFNITELFCESAFDQGGHDLFVKDSENFGTIGFCWASGKRKPIFLEKSGSRLTGRKRRVGCSGCQDNSLGMGGLLGPFGDAFYFKKKL